MGQTGKRVGRTGAEGVIRRFTDDGVAGYNPPYDLLMTRGPFAPMRRVNVDALFV